MLLALALGAAVVATLRTPPRIGPPVPVLPSAAGEKGATQTRAGELVELKGGDEKVKVRFKSMTGQQPGEIKLTGVELTFSYMASGQPGTSTVTADEATYTAALQKASFKGHVVLRTADGFEMRSATLNYRGDKGVVRSDDRVEFKRKRASGSSLGVRYDAQNGFVEFPAEPVVRVEYVNAPPLEIHGGRAELDRNEDELRFFDGVTCTRGADSLKAGRLVLAYSKDRRAINSMQAFDDAVLILTGATGSAFGMAGGAKGGGRREIRAPGLGLWFRPDGSLQESSAFFDAQMTMYPGPGELPEKRTLQARLLVFRFDAQSRLSEVQGQNKAALHAEPIPPAKGDTQDLTCKNLLARFQPGSGELSEVDARGDVEFRKGVRRATAERGRYDGPSGRLVLAKGAPTLEETGRSRLSAERIELMTRSGDLLAQGEARESLQAGRPGGFLVQEGQPTLLSAQRIAHDAAKRTSTYTGQALLRSGKDEVRADELQLHEDAKGGRSLEARQNVFSLLHPAEKAGAQKPAAPVEVRAGAMSYGESAARVAYTGDVTLKQGDIATVSPTATLYLGTDGRSLQRLVAGEPVELRQGQRKAQGQRATYTPENQTIVIEGAPVSLQGPGQDVRGRSLTFQTGNDTILVSGEEEGRTETVFRKEPPKP